WKFTPLPAPLSRRTTGLFLRLYAVRWLSGREQVVARGCPFEAARARSDPPTRNIPKRVYKNPVAAVQTAPAKARSPPARTPDPTPTLPFARGGSLESAQADLVRLQPRIPSPGKVFLHPLRRTAALTLDDKAESAFLFAHAAALRFRPPVSQTKTKGRRRFRSPARLYSGPWGRTLAAD